ncbi:hypothetical protein L6452_10453 [Arctium lappa]|uniref:Uncharacterized protein n=1 Tax=Arctium lappa TaxID=4217 RepID=A0ACB9DMS9_ARCLA|nr:hypothetical protein L6452_10453 [Arctium lappa]
MHSSSFSSSPDQRSYNSFDCDEHAMLQLSFELHIQQLMVQELASVYDMSARMKSQAQELQSSLILALKVAPPARPKEPFLNEVLDLMLFVNLQMGDQRRKDGLELEGDVVVL